METMLRKYFACLILILISGLHAMLLAQCKDNSYELLDVNQVSARFNNGANFFWDMNGATEYFVPKASGKSPTFAGGLWVGGLDPLDGLHVAASTYRQQGWDWYAGPYRDGSAYECEASVTTGSRLFYNGIKLLSNGKVLILTEDAVLIYDPITRLKLIRPLPATRLWMGAKELPDGRIFLFGDDTYPTKNPVLFMDTVNYQFTGGPTLNWFHKESSIELLNDGKLLLVGVVGCELFDPATNLSTAVPDMLYPRMKHGSCKLPNGDIFVCGGGSSLNGSGLTLLTQRYDDTLGYWFPGPTLSVGRQRAQVTTMPGGKIFISGGTLSSFATQIYDPIAGTLVNGANLPDSASSLTVMPRDSAHVVIASEGGLPYMGRLYEFNIYTGEYKHIYIQRNGVRAVPLDPQEVLVDVNEGTELQRVLLQSGIQDDDRWQKVWKMDRAQIAAFQADFQAGTVDFSQYPQIEIWPAHGNEALGEDRNLAPFIDVNGDGLYRPGMDGDYPCIVGDQALWWVMSDQGPHAETRGRPLGMQVEAMAYAFDCAQTPCPDTSMDYTVFLHLELTNRSDTGYHDMYVGQIVDVDLGNYADDFIGCDSSLGLTFGYNGTDSDNSYGIHPPAYGSAVMPNGMLGEMSAGIYYENDFTVMGNPSEPSDYYGYMKGFWKDSLPIVNNGIDGYPGTAAGPATSFMYSGTAGFCGGAFTDWSEIAIGRSAFDRRFLQSSGPFDLAADEKIQWDLAYIYARDSSHTASVCTLKDATVAIRDWWQNQLDKSCWSTLVGLDAPKSGSKALGVVPNPVGGNAVSIEFGADLLGEATLELMDLQGRIVERVTVQPGADQHVLDVAGLPAGLYIARLVEAGQMRTARMVVQ